jgi:hypothetical protein
MIDYKYNEGELIDQFKKYIDSTYDQHYSQNKYQATEFIIDGGHGTGFCIGNVMKYAQRYGKKGTDADARKDLLKVLHYALIQLYIHDSNVKTIEEWDDFNSPMDCPKPSAASSKSERRGLKDRVLSLTEGLS